MSSDPAREYRARLADRQAAELDLARREQIFSYARLGTFAAAGVLAVLWLRGAAPGWWLAAPALAFALLMHRHDRVIRELRTARQSIVFYQRGLGRIEDRWAGQGEPGEQFLDDHHLYANDLDLFGRGSLFELLSIARTRAGEAQLAEWLKTPASADGVRERQETVTELTPALDLREALAIAGADVAATGIDTDVIIGWAERAPVLGARWLRGMATGLTVCAVTAAAWMGITGNYAYLVAVLLLEAAFAIPQRSRVLRALHAADAPARDLDVLAHVLDRLEGEEFTSARLTLLSRQLGTSDVPASVAIRRLHRLVELHDWQHNQFFAPVAAALLWGTHLAWAIEAWQRRHGREVRTWLYTVGEFEALSSLSAYRFEHPADVWPEIVTDGAGFDGVGLGHPLLPAARMVRNDVRLWGDTRLLVVSGSNMSGKSTLLRTVGVNAVLALAGAPVRAAALRITPLAIGATLRIQDSLQEGRSRFFAEITRIRDISDTARGRVPLLFLLDELFHGTNSHDRLAGASGTLRSLLEHGAIGMITTHDLALTAVADGLSPRAINVHFEDHFDNGEIQFDYRMKPGPVTRSNALALMRAVGLDVEET
ncbi:MAG: DNA mismatch repair protein MutS [Acidobacteria bacterium]|nr:DNA mismatch repair protein MutS [Acidobacteriota bacterium]